MAETTQRTHCLFCSLCCAAGVAFDDMGLATPAYPGHTAQAHHGLCYRGHFISELVGHASRLHEGLERHDGALHALPPREAIARAAALVGGLRDDCAVVVDGNLPCEAIAAAVRAAREGLGITHCTIFIPPADEAVLRGLAAAAAPRVGEGGIADCDVVLAIGDPFATHPLVASPVLDALRAARGRRLLNVDSLRGRTARFATDFCQVRPGGEAAALAGLAHAANAPGCADALGGLDPARAAEVAGVGADALESLAGVVAKAQKLAVLVSLPEGRCAAAAAAAALAGKLAEARGGAVCPLLGYGNAVGAWRLQHALRAEPLAQLVAEMGRGSVRRLIVLGTDLLSAVPAAAAACGADGAEIIVAAAALPSQTAARARYVVPMPLWFELGGTVLDGAGEAVMVGAVAAPPAGSLTPAEVLEGLGAAAEKGPFSAHDARVLLAAEPSVALADVLGQASDLAPASGAPDRLVVVSRADGIGFADGALTTQLAWAALMEPRPALRLAPQEAARAGAAVTLRADGVALAVPVEASADVPPGVGALSPRFPEARPLFAWRPDGVGPGIVSMEKTGGNS